jgi:uncharacterized protein
MADDGGGEGASILWVAIVAFLLSASVSGAWAETSEDCVAASGRDDILRLCRPLAEQGDRNAQINLGRMYIGDFGGGMPKPEDAAEGLKWYRRAAEKGSVKAQWRLALAFEGFEGWRFGVPQDYAEAAEWYRKAADQGDALSQVALGSMYLDGKGVDQNYTEAMELFRRPAEKGYAGAQYFLGIGYERGQGVLQDYILAHMWLNLSAAQAAPGDDDAKKARDRLAAKMTPAQVAEAQRMARAWKPQ